MGSRWGRDGRRDETTWRRKDRRKDRKKMERGMRMGWEEG